MPCGISNGRRTDGKLKYIIPAVKRVSCMGNSYHMNTEKIKAKLTHLVNIKDLFF